MSEKDILDKEKDILPSEEEIKELLSNSKQLSLQSFETIKDPNSITPLTPEIISRQATMNIGTIGHVAHGKTTLVRAISGIQTTKHKIEKERNITYYLGYANAKLYKCPKCEDLDSYKAFGSAKEDHPKCEKCGETLQLLRHISFVDCPGHDILMATMLNGASVMDAALLLIASNAHCPEPQTREHLAAVENMNLENIIIVQNKIDLTKEGNAKENYNEIKSFVRGTKAANSPIIPISAQYKYNIEAVISYICNLPIPKRDFVSPPRFIIVRSFDVNRPGTEVENLHGGVAGGTLTRGILRLGDVVEIKPGLISKNQNGQHVVQPLFSRIVSLKAEENDLIYAVPGGLIGVGLKLDPFLTIKNKLNGRILGHPGNLPNIYTSIVVKTHLMARYVGAKGTDKNSTHVGEIKYKETLLINVGSTSIASNVIDISGDNKDIVKFSLYPPVCAEIGETVAFSRKLAHNWRLIGWGQVLEGGETI
jgi:translation initiation factor 2 subunit 3